MFSKALYSEEELGLFNPAFSGVNLYHAIGEYCKVREGGMHCALPFILLPISMNSAIRHELPPTYRTPIASWVSGNEGLLSVLVPQFESYIPIVKSSIKFLLERQLIEISDEGSYSLGKHSLPDNPSLFGKDPNMKAALKSAKFLGKWFSYPPSVETIYAQLGVMP